LADRIRIAVIGTGVVGACVGYHLAREGAEVLMVDAGPPGGLTTSASFAWVNASAKVERGTYFDLNFAGVREHGQLASELPAASWWHQTGHLRWDYANEAELTEAVQRLASRGYPVEVWAADRAQSLLEPNVRVASSSGLVALFPEEGWVDGPRMVQELVDAAVTMGATPRFGCPLRSVGVRDRAVTWIELVGGERHAVDGVVNAGGPAAATIAALVGRALPMKDSRGLVVRVADGGGSVRRVLHAPGISMRPDGPGRALLLSHAVESELTLAGNASYALTRDVLARGAQVVPEFASAIVTEGRVGQRPIPADDLPAIGPAGRIDGYYEAVMHSGITLGPLVGRALAAEIIRGEVDPLVAEFRASRFNGDTQPVDAVDVVQ
jgi:glycine/D-amino acid oxidase-like deaminating enzyme